MQLSIVIGFMDWGLDRVIGAVRSLNSALKNLDAEVIVSDYGSKDNSGYGDALRAEGVKYLYTTTNGVWSRSRALNAGLQIAQGDILVTTDADMVFTPRTFEIVVRRFQDDPAQYMVMQCRDLPEGINHEDIEAGTYTWERLLRVSRLRPRWGMGGMIAIPRTAYFDSRGLDERMEIYGGEDIDFARRMRRLGLKLCWLEHDAAQMYHVWHPSSRVSASESDAGRRAIARNRDIQLNDDSTARNLTKWQFAPDDRPPLVSVVISTFNRAQYLPLAVRSVLAQTMTDFELIVVNDGSTDHTRDVLENIGDDRVRVFNRHNQGLAAARNFATAKARGKYVAVMDDDDLMLPHRLETSLNAITHGANGSYGGWIDFVHETGARQFKTGKKLTMESLLFNNATYLHPTLMIERRLLAAVPYNEELRSGSDYNLAVRLLRSGAKLNHSGTYLLMRRLHEDQITSRDPAIQKTAGTISALFGRATMIASDLGPAKEDRATKDKAPITSQRSLEPRVIQYLPDEVVRRRALVTQDGSHSIGEAAKAVLSRGLRSSLLQNAATDEVLHCTHVIEDLTLAELFQLRSEPTLEIDVEAEILSSEGASMLGDALTLPEGSAAKSTSAFISMVSDYEFARHSDSQPPTLLIVSTSEAEPSRVASQLGSILDGASHYRSIANNVPQEFFVKHIESQLESVALALSARGAAPAGARVITIEYTIGKS